MYKLHIALCCYTLITQCASEGKKNKALLSTIRSFLTEVNADKRSPHDYNKISLYQDQEPYLRNLEKDIKQYRNEFKLTPAFIESIHPRDYQEKELLPLQLKCALYIAERTAFNIKQSELFYDCINLEQDRTYASLDHVDRLTLCIIGQLIKALHNPEDSDTEMILDNFLCDLGCISRASLPPYQRAKKRLKAMHNIITFLPSSPKEKINLIYQDVFTCRFKRIKDLLNPKASWNFCNSALGVAMTTLYKYFQAETTPLHHQTAKAALGLFDEITCNNPK